MSLTPCIDPSRSGRAGALSVLIALAMLVASGAEGPSLPWGATPAAAQAVPVSVDHFPQHPVHSHREQAGIVRGWIEKRFDTLLPELMRREGIDMWIIISREYNDDPVFRSMAPMETYSSRRRTILVFHDRGPGQPVERLSVGRFDYDGLFQVVPTHNDEQFEGLLEVVRERNPGTIGVNMSGRWNHADGLTATQRDTLFATLSDFEDRIRSAEMLAVGWLEVKLPEETDMYRHVMRVAHSIIARAFSNEVITPGSPPPTTSAGGCGRRWRRWGWGSGSTPPSPSPGREWRTAFPGTR
jgi:hypothetical protein